MSRKRDLTGKIFTELTVIKESKKRLRGERTWKCLCGCGNETLATTKDLNQERKKSCGCLRRRSPANVVDITGKVFGKLTVIKRGGHLKSTQEAKWLCKCECGNKVSVLGSSLRDGRTKSCGCLLPVEKQVKKVHKHVKENLTIDEVRVPRLKSRVRHDSRSGVKGVHQRERNGKISYEAHITLRGKRKHLGTFPSLNEAAQARIQAEKEYHHPYIKKLEENKNE